MDKVLDVVNLLKFLGPSHFVCIIRNLCCDEALKYSSLSILLQGRWICDAFTTRITKTDNSGNKRRELMTTHCSELFGFLGLAFSFLLTYLFVVFKIYTMKRKICLLFVHLYIRNTCVFTELVLENASKGAKLAYPSVLQTAQRSLL